MAIDGQMLTGQGPAVRAAYQRFYGARSDALWVDDHHRAIVAIEARHRIQSDPNAPGILAEHGLTTDTAPGLIAADVVARGQTYAYLVGCEPGSLWGRFYCGGVRDEGAGSGAGAIEGQRQEQAGGSSGGTRGTSTPSQEKRSTTEAEEEGQTLGPWNGGASLCEAFYNGGTAEPVLLRKAWACSLLHCPPIGGRLDPCRGGVHWQTRR